MYLLEMCADLSRFPEFLKKWEWLDAYADDAGRDPPWIHVALLEMFMKMR